eukprot:987854-Lingulodinium_polyedra.AAC.1
MAAKGPRRRQPRVFTSDAVLQPLRNCNDLLVQMPDAPFMKLDWDKTIRVLLQQAEASSRTGGHAGGTAVHLCGWLGRCARAWGLCRHGQGLPAAEHGHADSDVSTAPAQAHSRPCRPREASRP